LAEGFGDFFEMTGIFSVTFLEVGNIKRVKSQGVSLLLYIILGPDQRKFFQKNFSKIAGRTGIIE
jgi:hypothetical protein